MSLSIYADPTTVWITPEEQYQLLNQHKEFEMQISLATEKLIPVIVQIITQYLVDVDSEYTIWFDSLKALDALPKKVPRLDKHILQKLNKNSPKQTLLFIPSELGTLQQFREKIMSYFQKRYPQSEVYPLKTPNMFIYEYDAYCYSDAAGNEYYNDDDPRFNADDRNRRREFRNMPFGASHWELVPTVMPHIQGILKKTYPIKYEKQGLTNAIAAIFLYYIATGKSIYQPNESSYIVEFGKRVKWTEIKIPVKEKIGGDHVVIKYCCEIGCAPDVRCARKTNSARKMLKTRVLDKLLLKKV